MIFRKGVAQKKGIALFPNKHKVRSFIHRLREVYINSINLSAMELISKLNPIIRG